MAAESIKGLSSIRDAWLVRKVKRFYDSIHKDPEQAIKFSQKLFGEDRTKEEAEQNALRDTFATYYAEANADKGGDIKTLQELMGHAKMSITTDLYMHALDENKVAGMKRVESFIG